MTQPAESPWQDISKREQSKGAAMTPGHLDALAEERAASMADEGGRSAAQVERQVAPRMPRRRSRWFWWAFLALPIAIAVAVIVCWRAIAR